MPYSSMNSCVEFAVPLAFTPIKNTSCWLQPKALYASTIGGVTIGVSSPPSIVR